METINNIFGDRMSDQIQRDMCLSIYRYQKCTTQFIDIDTFVILTVLKSKR